MNGKTLGHYRVGEQLGRGGMGEVYVADDLSLDRKVALKFLPAELSGNPELMARFEREAKLLASLNHPNIAAIHGLEQAEGKRFIVMELVEGETLAQRLSKDSLPVGEALGICRQIAEGLEAAHEKGVIHRDLKPANVMVAVGDRVKILDFGLAKALSGETQTVDASLSPTIAEAMTQPGIILGTAAYMSPEQAKGKAVDRRADIWAFGCILYECLTGKKAFAGDTVTEILASVLKGEPEWKTLPDNLHPRIRIMLERCLKKDPRDRYGSISDCRVDIQEALADPSGVMMYPAITSEPRKKLRTILLWAASLVLVGIIAGMAAWKLKSPEPKRVIRFDYLLPENPHLSEFSYRVLAVSPDGQQFVCSTSKGLYWRSASDPTGKLIAGTEGATRQPFFSPDGTGLDIFL